MVCKPKCRNSWRSAFTLTEMAIVITLIGLVAGVILIGRDMVGQGELRTLSADLTSYEGAVITFRDKYNALPGDLSTATAVWGVLGGTGSDAACQAIAATGRTTCNGNNNGVIGTSAIDLDESFRAWQHLSNAQLIKGTYTGVGMGVPIGNFIGTVVPKTGMDTVGIQFAQIIKSAPVVPPWGWTNIQDAGIDHATFLVAAPSDAAAPTQLLEPGLSPYQVSMLDEKMDDRKPATGKIFVSATYAQSGAPPGQCITTRDANTSTYVFASESPVNGCLMHYKYLSD